MADSDSDSGSSFYGFSEDELDIASPDSSSDESVSSDEDDNVGQWSNVFNQPTIQQFTEEPGPKLPDSFDPANAIPLEYFLLLFPVELLCLITRMTNEYAVWRMSQPGVRFDDLWEEVTVSEMRAFISINILMGIQQLPSTKMYWSTNPLIGNSSIGKIMTCNRFQRIMKYLHVSDRSTEPSRGDRAFDKLFKVRPIIDSLSDTFRRYYTLHREVSIDEAMVAFAGRLLYRQYMPAKPLKRGIKVWMLCDAQTAYLSRFDIYLGRQDNRTEHGLGYNVVMKLSDHLKDTFRLLFFDNFFTGIELLQQLLDVGLYACGTVRCNRKGFPQELKKPTDIKNRGDFKVLQKRHTNLTASVWRTKSWFILSPPSVTLRRLFLHKEELVPMF